jgi:hypothetical protein
MEDVHFKAVAIEAAHPEKIRCVRTAKEAYECLVNEWHDRRRGPAYARAKLACMGAMDGSLSADEARAAFIDAASEADILVATHTRVFNAILPG